MPNKKIEPLLDEDVYRELFRHLVHFSFKATNTNIAGGIQVAESYKKAIPYACFASSVHYQGVSPRPDYCRNAATQAKPFKHLTAALSKKGPQALEDQSLDKKERSAIEEEIEARQHYGSIKDLYQKTQFANQLLASNAVDARHSQVLIPFQDDYFAVTPVASPGFALKVREAEGSADAWLSKAERSIGGANSQNAGGLIYSLRRPIYLDAPIENSEVKRAYSILYRGLGYRVPRNVFEAYLHWRSELMMKGRLWDHDRRTKDVDMRYAKKLFFPFLRSLKESKRSLEVLSIKPDEIDVYATSEEHRAILEYCLEGRCARSNAALLGRFVARCISKYKLGERQLGWDADDIRFYGKQFAEVMYGR